MELSKNSSRFFGRHRRSPSNLQPTSVSEQEPSYEPQRPRGSRNDLKITSVNEQTAELFQTTNHVLVQIAETKRLRDLKGARLAPSERQWIDSTIEDTTNAAREVSLFLEPTRVERETSGRLSLSRQLKWKYRDNQRAQEKKNHLLLCHNSLMTVLSHLQRLNHLETPMSSPSIAHELVGNLTQLELTSTTSSVHELGGTTPIKLDKFDKFDSFDAGRHTHHQRSDSEFTKLSDEKIEDKGPVNLTFQESELNDLLAWRRSKGTGALPSASVIDIKPIK